MNISKKKQIKAEGNIITGGGLHEENYSPKLKEITFMKTISMILIVLYHSCLFFSGGGWFDCVKPVFNVKYISYFTFILNTIHVQAFTFASGFLYFYLKSIGRYENQKEFIINKVKRLLIPLVFASILWVIPFYIHYFGFDIKQIIHKFILLEAPSQLWFLPMLFLIFLVFNMLYKKIKFDKKNLIIVFILSNLISGILIKLNLNYFNITNAIRFSFYFYLGGYIFKNKGKLSRKNIITVFFLVPVIGTYVIFTKKIDNSILNMVNYVATSTFSGLAVIVLYIISDYLINKKKIKTDNHGYKLLSENSFGIYLFHQQIIYITITLFNGLVHPIIQCILSFLISLCISLVMTLILKKNKLTKKIFSL